MPRQRPEYAQTSWQDIAECVPAWEKEAGVRVAIHITWQPHLSSGACVEAVLLAGNPLEGHKELVRVRQPFPTRKASGQAGAALHAIFLAFAELERNPWLWSPEQRAAARGEG